MVWPTSCAKKGPYDTGCLYNKFATHNDSTNRAVFIYKLDMLLLFHNWPTRLWLYRQRLRKAGPNNYYIVG